MKNTILKLFLALAISTTLFQSAIAGKSKSVEFLNPGRPSTSTAPYSKAVRAGDTLYLAGHLGIDPKTGKLAKGGIKGETKQTMDNIQSTLKALGYSMGDLVKCVVMLADISEWGEFNKVYAPYFKKNFPARSAFGANGIALGARVEVECIAYIGK